MFIEKNLYIKWTNTVQTCIIQGSTVYPYEGGKIGELLFMYFTSFRIVFKCHIYNLIVQLYTLEIKIHH